MNEETINIGEIFTLLKKKYKIILISVLACGLAAGIFSFFIVKPKYESKVKVFIGKEETAGEAGYNNNEVQMYQKLLTTYAEIIKTEDLVKTAVEEFNVDVGDKTPEKILADLTVTPRSDTQILEIGYKDTDQSRTVLVVEAITRTFMEKSKDLITNGNVQIIQEAKYPVKPISPNKKMNMMISVVLGLMIGIGIVLLLEFIDNTFKNREDLEKTLDLPVLGAIPEYDAEEVRNHYHSSGSRVERKRLAEKQA